ncbi:MAG: UDP-3-O-(3-hydroxymyristoyl)glucosamine N-acyltransferase [Gammaproteobacteria bacterium]|nr:UDP-3-O-(3-hydroxymyristoyl)glucosamine N-acyltransferase [Gammaproteobacteria bacterium]
MKYRLADLAARIGAELQGDADCEVDSVAQLQDATAGSISFLANSQYLKHLASTRAAAVILSPELAVQAPGNVLVSTNPYLCYAKAAALLHPQAAFTPGRHPSAVIDQSARIAGDAWIGPCSVIEAEVEIEGGVFIGPGCVVGRGCRIGLGSRLVARVTLCSGTRIGERTLIHPGAVLGSDGFGLANDEGRWIKVPQLGGVVIGNDVEIGANTTIDCGTIRDTIIADGVKLDNQIQIAHNVEIGENSAIAGCAGIAGSTKVGRNCTLGGGVGLAGHLEIGDNVHFSGQSLVTRSFDKPGYYSGNLPAVANGEWRKTVARIRRLDDIMQRLKAVERRLKALDSQPQKGD